MAWQCSRYAVGKVHVLVRSENFFLVKVPSQCSVNGRLDLGHCHIFFFDVQSKPNYITVNDQPGKAYQIQNSCVISSPM